MATRRYEISLRVASSVEKYFTSERSERVKYFQHEKRNFVSPSGHVMFYLLYKHQWNTKPFHRNSFFPAKGAIYYAAIATVSYHVFAQKLTWYFTGVYIIKIYIYQSWLQLFDKVFVVLLLTVFGLLNCFAFLGHRL